MTAGLKRCYLEGSIHFITFSCYRRQPHPGTAARRDLFLRVLEHARRRYGFALLGYVVMPEHVHLLMTMPLVGDPSVVMKVVKERFTRLLRKREGFHRRRWQKRFYDFKVCTDRKRVEKFRYNASESGETRLGSKSRGMGVEQFSDLLEWRKGVGRS